LTSIKKNIWSGKTILDKDEKIRTFLNYQKEKVARVSPILAIILLAFTNSLLLYEYIRHRNIHPYIGITIMFFLFMIVIWIVSHLYVIKLGMYRTEAKAKRMLDPYAVYALCPYEEMWFREVFIPLHEANIELLPEGKTKERVTKSLEKIKTWVDKGVIPYEHSPKHLQKYYITKDVKRL